MTLPKDALLFSFFNEIGIIEQLTRTQMERVLPDGLRMSHFTVLNHFVRLGGEKTPLELARAFQVTKGAMTNTLNRLETRGLVMVRPDPDDGRSKRVSITEEGRAVREDALKCLQPLLQKVEGAFSTEAFENALPFLQEIRQFLDQDRDE